MAFDISRRWFIGGLVSFGSFGGSCMLRDSSGKYSIGTPKLKFGVISDVHLYAHQTAPGLTPGGDTKTLELALAWYRDQGVDAVAVVGDIADHGLVEEMEAFAAAWFKVFPDDRAPDGRRVERIVLYGNHDWGGVHYKPFISKKHPSVSDHSQLILMGKPKEHWQRIFHEPWERVYRKDIKGYAFIGAHWTNGWCRGRDEVGIQGLEDFFAAQKGKIDSALPFFYFQHPHPKDTCYGSWAWGRDNGTSTAILSKYSNSIAFSGHSHYSLTDERSIWQGAFTSIGTSSLRYTSVPANCRSGGYENGSGVVPEKHDPAKVMDRLRTHDGRQGMLVSVYDDHITFARRDFVLGELLGEDWVLPLPAAESKPFAFAAHAKKVAVPEFASGAKVTVSKIRRKTRGWSRGKAPVQPEEKDSLDISFPPANGAAGVRVFDYEISVIPKAGGNVDRRYVISQGFNKPASDARCKETVHCLIAEDQLPIAGTYRLEVRPRNCFGKAGSPISAG